MILKSLSQVLENFGKHWYFDFFCCDLIVAYILELVVLFAEDEFSGTGLALGNQHE